MTSSTTSAISCRETSYITPKGLGFSLYCNKDQTSLGDINNVGTDSVEDCMNQCSTHPLQLCGAAAFDSINLRCFFKNASITADGAVTRNGWVLGIADETQLQPLSETCSNNGQTQTTPNGLQFIIYCNQTLVVYDVCDDSAPDCRVHTNTFDECLEFCSTMHPLCTGVAWDPTLRVGYQNCYPKNASALAFDSFRSPTSNGIRSGKALLEPANDDCRASANTTVAASNKEIFELSCEESRTGNNITVQHAASLGNCIDSCTGPLCFGAVFDAKMVDGFENCYLKSTIGGSIPDQDGFTFAKRQDAGNDSTPDNPSPGQTHGGSKAWIAGPVIGAIVFIIFIIAALWWWRRKSRSREMQNIQNALEQDPWAKAELDPTTISTPTYELDSQTRSHGIHGIELES